MGLGDGSKILNEFDLELLTLQKKCNRKSLRWLDLSFLFLRTFDPHNVHNMVAIMLDLCFKSLQIVENYVGHCGVIFCFASKYDTKVMIPLLMAWFDWLNPTSQTCATTTDVPNFQFEKKEGNMFGVGASMEESSCAFVAREFLFI